MAVPFTIKCYTPRGCAYYVATIRAASYSLAKEALIACYCAEMDESRDFFNTTVDFEIVWPVGYCVRFEDGTVAPEPIERRA